MQSNFIKSPVIINRNKPKSNFRKRLEQIKNAPVVIPAEKEPSIFSGEIGQKEWVESWKPNVKTIERQTYLKKQKLKNAMAKIKLIRILFNVRKDKSEYVNALETLENDNFIIQVLQNDEIFREQLKNAMPETKYYINKLLHIIDAEYVIKPKVDFGVDRTETKRDMISLFKNKMNVTMTGQTEQTA